MRNKKRRRSPRPPIPKNRACPGDAISRNRTFYKRICPGILHLPPEMALAHPLLLSALALALVFLSRFGAAEVPRDPRYVDPAPPDSSLVPMGDSGRVRDGACFKIGVGSAALGIDRVVRNDEQREASSVRAAGALFEVYIGGSLQRDTTVGALILSQSFGKQGSRSASGSASPTSLPKSRARRHRALEVWALG